MISRRASKFAHGVSPIYARRAEGARFWDIDGHEYIDWVSGIGAIILGCGAPMVLLVNAGLLFAPAAHGGALFPGVMPLMVALMAAAILKEAFTSQKTVGLP